MSSDDAPGQAPGRDGTTDEAVSTPAATSWRELAVSRSLDSARVRAEGRVQRFLDAAVELMRGEGGKDFTVQEVVERSGQSLRSFYQYFDGKYELLLALFEESVRSTADHLHEVVGSEDDPVERLHLFAVEYFALCVPASERRSTEGGPTPAMAEFAHELLTEHPKEAARAFVPLVELFADLFDAALASGAIRSDVSGAGVAGIVLQAIMFHAFATTISGVHADADPRVASEALWSVIFYGISAAEPDRPR